MLLTVRSKYAILVVADIAAHGSQGPVSVRDICSRQNVTARYVEQICSDLVRGGLIRSFKGPGGGYCLCEGPADINIMLIVNAVGESVKMTICGSGGTCNDNGERCVIHGVLAGLGKCIREYFCSVSVADILNHGSGAGHKAGDGMVSVFVAEDACL